MINQIKTTVRFWILWLIWLVINAIEHSFLFISNTVLFADLLSELIRMIMCLVLLTRGYESVWNI